MDIELAVDAIEIAPHIDQMVLFSGDGDFTRLVEAVQRRGVRVVVVSSMSMQPPMIAQELRRHADEFIDIKALQNTGTAHAARSRDITISPAYNRFPDRSRETRIRRRLDHLILV